MRRRDAFALLEAARHGRIENPRREQRAFHGVRGVPGSHHRVDRLREFREVRKWIHALQVELARDRIRLALNLRRESKRATVALFDPTVGHQHEAPKPIAILHFNESRFLHQTRRGANVFLRVFRNALECRFEYRRDPLVPIEYVPHCRVIVNRDGLHAGLAALAAFDHALHPFERVEPIRLEARIADLNGTEQFTSLGKYEFGLSPSRGHG